MSASIPGDLMDNDPIIDPVVMGDPEKPTGEDVFYKNDHRVEEKTDDRTRGVQKVTNQSRQNDPDLSQEGAVENQSKLRFDTEAEYSILDPKAIEQQKLINSSTPSNQLEVALYDEIKRKDVQIERLTGEVLKLKQFVSKRKQVYKRKRKDEGAPTRALSAYNIFVQDRFSRLAKENEEALKSSDSDAKLKRVPPASLVASTGNQWKELPAEEKAYYEER